MPLFVGVFERGVAVRMNMLGTVIVTLLLVSLPLYAIDSLQDLLKKGTNAEKKREKEAKKAGTAAAFSLTSGERIQCVAGEGGRRLPLSARGWPPVRNAGERHEGC